MTVQALLNLNRLSNQTVLQLGDVITVATENNDHGVVDWAVRALADARAIGRLRDRDVATLQRLQEQYSHDFYRTRTRAAASDLIFA